MTTLSFDTGGTSQPKVPQGAQGAYLISIIDLGKQEVSGPHGGIKHQVLVAFEFPDIIIEWEADNGIKHSAPAVINRRFTASMHKKAALRKFVEEVAGKKFPTEDAAKNFDLGKLLGRQLLLNIGHTAKDDKTYCNILSAQPCPAKMKTDKPQHHASWLYSTAEPDTALFERFPEWLQKLISGRVITDKSDKAAKASVAKDLDDEFNDDIPF